MQLLISNSNVLKRSSLKQNVLKRSVLAALTISFALLSHYTNAVAVTGNINVQIEIGSGCQINGHGALSQPLDFGTIDFGRWMSLTTATPNIDADTTGSSSAGFTIQCNTAAPYTVTVGSGLHFDSTRRMLNTTAASTFVGYNLYRDAARSTLWAPNTPVSFTSTGSSSTPVTTKHDFYGRVPSQTQATAGVYKDTVLVTVAW